MSRLLICAGKKFLCPFDSELLIPYNDKGYLPLNDWVKLYYRVSVVREQGIPQTDVVLVTVVDEGEHFPGKILSFAQTLHTLAEEASVVDYLKSIREAMQIQLQYGILEGKLVSIEDISPEKKGLRCGCTCPGCGGKLVARLGRQKRHHFSHHDSTGCNIEHAHQTALHMLAKEIIEQDKLFAFPGYSVSRSEINWDNRICKEYRMPASLEYRKPYTAKCTSVALEKRVSDFVPDIVVDVQGRICLIEIAVTHFVDEAKQEKINKLGLPVVEVDLSSFIGQQITRDIIRNALTSQITNKKWLFNPLREKAFCWAKEEYDKLYKAALAQEEAEEQERKKRALKERQKELNKERKRAETSSLLEELLEPENYKSELQQLRSDDKFKSVLHNFHFRKDIGAELPFFLDIPITGEMVFPCDRRIWQSAIFDQFIYYRKMDELQNVPISIKKIQFCIQKHMDFVPIDWKLTRKAAVSINGNRHQFTLFYDVIKKYLDYLNFIGFVSKLYYGEGTVARVKTLDPPNMENTKLLKNALERIDRYAPDVDMQIEQILHPPQKPIWSLGRVTKSSIEDVALAANNSNYKTTFFSRGPIRSENVITAKQDKEDQYSAGRLQAAEHDFERSISFYDKYHYRWLKCEKCGAIKRDDEMLLGDGVASRRTGICKECG